ncbi:MAG: hypothetical protein WDZ75_01230 [Candidatus Paceibacterota bacterium]
MDSFQPGIKTIHTYPFNKNGLVVEIWGKPIDGRAIIQNGGDYRGLLARHVFKLGKEGPKRIISPVPEHKDNITSSKELKILSAQEGQAVLYRGNYADGAIVNRGEVYALASADCPTVSIHDPCLGTTIVVHFSRESGVVRDILKKALTHFSPTIRSRVVATISLGIHTENFQHRWDDPQYGEANRKLIDNLIDVFGENSVSEDPRQGGINLRFIAAETLLRAG